MDEFQNVTRRKIWVQHLANNTSDGGITTEQLEKALDWANTTTIDYDSLHSKSKTLHSPEQGTKKTSRTIRALNKQSKRQ